MKRLLDSLVGARMALGWTQEQLAERAKVSRTAVRQAESGATDPRLSTMCQMGSAMEMELMMVPMALRQEVEHFIQAGGRWLGHPPGVSAPLSIVDEILSNERTHKT